MALCLSLETAEGDSGSSGFFELRFESPTAVAKSGDNSTEDEADPDDMTDVALASESRVRIAKLGVDDAKGHTRQMST